MIEWLKNFPTRISYRKKDRNSVKSFGVSVNLRFLAGFLVLSMLFSSEFVTRLNLTGVPSKVEASTYDEVFRYMVEQNITTRLKINTDVFDSSETLAGTIKVDELKTKYPAVFPASISYSEDKILAAIESSKTAETKYSVVNVSSIMSTLLGNGDYTFYEYNEKTFGTAVYTYQTTTTNDASLDIISYIDQSVEKVNPWEKQSLFFKDTTPLSPGLDYSGQAMSANYTVGQMIVDYLHSTYSISGLVKDSQIMDWYDDLATQANSPFVDMDTLREKIKAEVEAGSLTGSAGKQYTAMLGTGDMITYQQYIASLPADSPIPAGTLFIGTWLMDAQSVTEPFYRMAVESMTTYNQQVMLYKSELSSGYWKNIYGASGLDDILPVAENVPEYEVEEEETVSGIAGIVAENQSSSENQIKGMAGYYIDIIVGKDGIPRKAKTGEEVDVFSLISPYELDTLPELRALKAMFDSGVVTEYDSSKPKAYIYRQLKKFFEYDQPYALQAVDVTKAGYNTYRTFTKEEWADGCQYIFTSSNKGNVAYYAEDPGRNRRVADVMGETGRAFLNSIELTAEYDPFGDGFLRYNYGGHGEYSGSKFYTSILIRGDVVRASEKAWEKEINSLPHRMDSFNESSQMFRITWRHQSQIHDDITNQVDARMENMKGIYKELCLSGSAEDKELAYVAINVESALDSLRRYEAYYNLVENEDANFFIGPALPLLYECITEGKCSLGVDFNAQQYTSDDYSPDDAITSAVEEAIVSCTESMYDYQQQALMPGTTIASQLEYELSNNIIDSAPSGTANIRPALRQLLDLENINKNVIAHKSRELSLVTNTLLPTADAKFANYVHEGVGEDYRRAAAYSTTTQTALDEILKDQKAGVSAVAAELQGYIKARAMRLPTADAIDFINERINRAEALRPGITEDAFNKYAGEALDDHIEWLRKLLATVSEGGDLTDDGTDYGYDLGKYEDDLADALNNGDLDAAANAERKLNEAARQAEALEKAKNDAGADPGASAADKANATDANTPSGVGDKIFSDARAQIADNDWGKLEDDINALIDIGSPKLEDLLPELEGNNAPANLINKVKEGIENLGDNEFSDHYGSSDTNTGDSNSNVGDQNTGGEPVNPGDLTDPNAGGNGTGGNNDGTNTGGLDKDKIDMAIEDALGKDPSELTDEEGAATLAALAAYDDVLGGDDDDLDAYIQELLQKLIEEHNAFLYRQYLEDTSREYVSLAAVSRCRKYTRFRLVTKDGISTMSQTAGGSASYGFEIGKKSVIKNNGSQEKMDVKTESQEDEYLYGNKIAKYPYICEESSGKYLYCSCAYIKDTEWAVLITPSTDKKIAQLLDMLDIYADEDF